MGEDFHHLVLSLDGDLSAAPNPPGQSCEFRAFPLAKTSMVSLKNLRRLKAAIVESQPDLLCTYNFGSVEAAIANTLGPRRPHIHHEDGFGSDEAAGRQHIRRIVARRIALREAFVVVPSTGLERSAVHLWRLKRRRVRRIRPGIDVERFKRVPRPPPRDEVVVGSIGALRPEKNFARLIQAFAAASAGLPARLVVYGDGPERQRLTEAAAATGVGVRISLPGSARPEDALSEFDIFALSSDTEQTPFSLMEAMAAGLPAVVTDVGDIRRMISEESGDCVVRAADEALYIDRLRALLLDEPLRRRLGAANQRRAADFSESAMIEDFRQLYLEAIHGSAR